MAFAIEVPHYSTDIAAAWQVMRRLLRYTPTVWYYPDEKKWHAVFTIRYEINGTWYSYGTVIRTSDTEAHAICLAALALVDGIEERGEHFPTP